MKRFSQFANCLKCGSALKDIEWKKQHLGAGLFETAPVIPEQLVVVCRCCGFKDTFTPLDTPSNVPVVKGSISKHALECNVWVGVQQCEAPDNSRICTCGYIQYPARRDLSDARTLEFRQEDDGA